MPYRYNAITNAPDYYEGGSSITTDSGSASPSSGNAITIQGGTGINTSASGNAVSINLSTPVAVSSGGTGVSSFSTNSLLIGGDPITELGVLSKGSLLVGNDTGTPSFLAIGQNGQILTADQTAEYGVSWGDNNVDLTAFGEQLVAQVTPEVLIHFPYNINSLVVNTSSTGSGTVTHSGQFAVIQSGAASSSSAYLESNRYLEYHPGMGALIRFTAIFDYPKVGNRQLVGIGTSDNGFFFGYDGLQFLICRLSEGVYYEVPQEEWNVDPMDGTGPSGMTLDTNKGNVFQIRYQWLGFGAQYFYIENQYTGTFQLVHRIDYANQNKKTSVANPSFPFRVVSENTTNTSNVIVKIPSIAMFVEGQTNNANYIRHAVDNEKTIAGSTLTNILTIKNKTTYQGITNTVQIQPDFLAISSDGTKNYTFRMLINATLGGTPNYVDVDTNTSVVSWDTAGTTVTGGYLVATVPLSKVGQTSITFTDYDFILSPGSTLTIAAESSAGGDATAGISWQSRFT